jgi:hypothetical protein
MRQGGADCLLVALKRGNGRLGEVEVEAKSLTGYEVDNRQVRRCMKFIVRKAPDKEFEQERDMSTFEDLIAIAHATYTPPGGSSQASSPTVTRHDTMAIGHDNVAHAFRGFAGATRAVWAHGMAVKSHIGAIATLPALVRAPQRKTDIGSKVFGNEFQI